MAITTITSAQTRGADAPSLIDRAGRDGTAALAAAAARCPAEAPLAFLVHGFLYRPPSPDEPRPARDPHRSIYATDPRYAENPRAPGPARLPPRLRPWAPALGFRADTTADGLAVGFAWPSLPRAEGSGPGLARRFAAAYRAAEPAASGLARAVEIAATARPAGRIDLFAHSLGARVALLALRLLVARGFGDRLGLVLALGPAEYRDLGLRAARLCGGGGPTVVNLFARANDPFDGLLQLFGPRPWRAPAATPLGVAGLAPRAPSGWIDLQLDHPALGPWLERQGAPPPPRPSRFCHWSFYARPGMGGVLGAILRRAIAADELAELARAASPEPRWARFGARPTSGAARAATSGQWRTS